MIVPMSFYPNSSTDCPLNCCFKWSFTQPMRNFAQRAGEDEGFLARLVTAPPHLSFYVLRQLIQIGDAREVRVMGLDCHGQGHASRDGANLLELRIESAVRV